MLERCTRAVAVLTGVVVLSGASPGVDFKRLELKIEGRVAHVLSRDLDGDDMAELLAFARQGPEDAPQRRLAYWRATTTGFDAQPAQLLTLPDDAVVVDACDVLPAPGAEIVMLTVDGLSAFARTPGGTFDPTPRPLLAIPGVLGFPDDEDAPFYQMCRRPRGAATPVELWVPTSRGVAVVVPRDGALAVAQHLAMRPRAYHQSGDEFRGPRARRDFAVLTMLVIPRLSSMDADNDGDDDLYQVVEDTVMLFTRTDGVLSAQPTYRRGFNLRTPTDRAKRNAVMDVMLGDVNGDKLPDAVVTKLAGGMTSLKSETHYYVGLGAAGFQEKPGAVRKMSGYATPLAMLDVDGDGRMEVLEPDIQTTPVAVAGMLVKQRLDADVRVLRGNGAGLSEGKDMTVPFALDTSGAGGVKGSLPLVGEDVNGDGLVDLVNLGSGDEVEVMRGRRGDPPFEEDAAWTGDARSTLRAAWHVPWDGGPASVVVFYPDPKISRGGLLVFFNLRTSKRR